MKVEVTLGFETECDPMFRGKSIDEIKENFNQEDLPDYVNIISVKEIKE